MEGGPHGSNLQAPHARALLTSTRERRGGKRDQLPDIDAAPTTACTPGAANRLHDPQLRPCRDSPRQPPKESFDDQRVENRDAQSECWHL